MDPTTTMGCTVRPLPTEMAYEVVRRVSSHGCLFAPNWRLFARDGAAGNRKGTQQCRPISNTRTDIGPVVAEWYSLYPTEFGYFTPDLPADT